MTIPSTIKQIILHQRPTAAIEPTTFKAVQVAGSDLVANLKEDQVIVRVDYVSLDPAMRGWLRTTRSYLPPVQIGEVMRAAGLGEVVRVGSAVTKVRVGDFVQAGTGSSRRSRAMSPAPAPAA
jgi:NADPH-dependent curcumin reductase CurA